ncbi:GD21396 [Drosophila simulans]|uniref:GD21396 n=1 Tax=Drosophila simulans TaxID=7240 RepID=B4QZE1_DROSI|nr:GD21396 [Drosophila simulans]
MHKSSCSPPPNAPKLNSQLSQHGQRMLPSGAETAGRTKDADERHDDADASDAGWQSFFGERARGTGIGDIARLNGQDQDQSRPDQEQNQNHNQNLIRELVRRTEEHSKETGADPSPTNSSLKC